MLPFGDIFFLSYNKIYHCSECLMLNGFFFSTARQLIEYPYGDGLEVVMGGGRRNFLPCGELDPQNGILKKTKCRKDGRNLTDEWLKEYNNSAYVWNKDQLAKIDPNKVDHLLGKIFLPFPSFVHSHSFLNSFIHSVSQSLIHCILSFIAFFHSFHSFIHLFIHHL